MKINEIGGEFALIEQLRRITAMDHGDLIVGVGDDAAVIRTAPEPAPYLLVTTDILMEGSHFKTAWATAEQIGVKAAECNISDIAAMGGKPTWMFISLVLCRDTPVQWVHALYCGINHSCRRHGVIVAGGDTTQGMVNTINIALLGSVAPQNLCLRSQARPGDLIMVTGTLGASAAALALLLENHRPTDYLFEKHVSPTCRMDIAGQIAELANAMIDISDGLGSEVHHICRQSKTGAIINAAAIPLHNDVLNAARQVERDPLEFAISGGEDFELLFTISREKHDQLKKTGIPFHCVGKVVEKNAGVLLAASDGRTTVLPGGYNHFNPNVAKKI